MTSVSLVSVTVYSTCVDEAPRCAFAELFGFVGQRDLHDPGDVARGGLDSDGVRRDQLRRRAGKKKLFICFNYNSITNITTI